MKNRWANNDRINGFRTTILRQFVRSTHLVPLTRPGYRPLFTLFADQTEQKRAPHAAEYSRYGNAMPLGQIDAHENYAGREVGAHQHGEKQGQYLRRHEKPELHRFDTHK